MSASLLGQNSDDNQVIRHFYEEALSSWEAYHQLEWLCKNTKGRISGTPEAAAAVEYTYQVMQSMGLDSVWKQEIMVKNWKRGETEVGRIVSNRFGTTELAVCALGLSPATGTSGLSAEVIEIMHFDELKSKKDQIKGKIVFFNRHMDQKLVNTFASYGGAVNQRSRGPAMAAALGAAACLVRSQNPEIDNYPHTGVTQWENEEEMLPAFAVSTLGANELSQQLADDPKLRVYLRSTCSLYPDTPSHNVIGEIKGALYPDEIITIGGHLDAWDISEGAHDDGGGCIQAIEVLRLFQSTGIRPKHTLRAVMFMDEEIAQRGGQAYAAAAMLNNEKHIAAMESDRGVLTPRAVAIACDSQRYKNALKWEPLFESYNLKMTKGGGGVDIGPLRKLNPEIVFLTVIPDDQRYFRYHHSAFDRFEEVDRREMQSGSAMMAALIYLFDHYGL